jgi:hypothetical protein
MADVKAYASVLGVLSVALLLAMAGSAKKQIVWKQPRPVRCDIVAGMPQSRETSSSTIKRYSRCRRRNVLRVVLNRVGPTIGSHRLAARAAAGWSFRFEVAG